MKRLTSTLGSVVVVVCTLFAASAHATLIHATAALDQNQEVPASGSLAAANAILVVDATNNLIGLGLAAAGITLAEITFAEGPLAFGGIGPLHIHNAPPGVNGPVVVPFGNAEFYTQFEDRLEVVTTEPIAVGDDFVRELRRGNLYLNLHSLEFPGGVIRGQLSVVPEGATAIALMAGLIGLIAIRIRTRV